MATLRDFMHDAKKCVVINVDGLSDQATLAGLAAMEDVTVADLSADAGMSWAWAPRNCVDVLKAHQHAVRGWVTPDMVAMCETCQQRPTSSKNAHGHFVCDVCSRAGLANPPQLRRDVGRNDKCFCGSGKKYKKCCLLKGH